MHAGQSRTVVSLFYSYILTSSVVKITDIYHCIKDELFICFSTVDTNHYFTAETEVRDLRCEVVSSLCFLGCTLLDCLILV
jgi:hypothetical protein